MKILLVGEFSGVHTNLKKALIAKGHTVAIVGKHDGFKKFDSDLNVSPYIGNTIGKFKNILKQTSVTQREADKKQMSYFG